MRLNPDRTIPLAVMNHEIALFGTNPIHFGFVQNERAYVVGSLGKVGGIHGRGGDDGNR